jgi:hypothetical protein
MHTENQFVVDQAFGGLHFGKMTAATTVLVFPHEDGHFRIYGVGEGIYIKDQNSELKLWWAEDDNKTPIIHTRHTSTAERDAILSSVRSCYLCCGHEVRPWVFRGDSCPRCELLKPLLTTLITECYICTEKKPTFGGFCSEAKHHMCRTCYMKLREKSGNRCPMRCPEPERGQNQIPTITLDTILNLLGLVTGFGIPSPTTSTYVPPPFQPLSTQTSSETSEDASTQPPVPPAASFDETHDLPAVSQQAVHVTTSIDGIRFDELLAPAMRFLSSVDPNGGSGRLSTLLSGSLFEELRHTDETPEGRENRGTRRHSEDTEIGSRTRRRFL